MRRLGLLVIGVGAAVLGVAPPALAAPSPPAAGQGSAAETACTLSDSRLIGLSGLVAQSDGYVVVNTSPDSAAQMRVFALDSGCKVSRVVSYPTTPRDPEDLAVAPDGTLWVGDIGDNSTGQTNRRESIALWKVPAAGGTPVIYRLTYPDGPHDARALLIGADGNPIIVTKESGGAAQIYTPTATLQANTRQGVPLKNVGSWKPTRTGTANFLGATGQILVTGAAQSPDRKRVALRTYSDAYEWDVPDGDIVKAITTGKPRVTPLAGEPQGEAIAYSADGKSFLTVSNQPAPGKILRYQPVSAAAPLPAAASRSTTKADTRPWYQKLSLPQIINIVAGVGVLGLVLVVVGVIGIRQSRKARRSGFDEDGPDLPGRGDDGAEYPPPVGAAASADAKRRGRVTVDPVDLRQVDPRQVDPRQVDPRQHGRPAGGAPVPGDAQRSGRARVAPPADPQRPGRATVAPPDAGRQGRQPAPPANPRPGRPAQPGRGGSGGGNVYGGGQPRPGYDQRGGRQEYAQPGYRTEHDGDGRHFSERI